MTQSAQPVVMHLISSLKVGGAERLLVSVMQAAVRAGSFPFVVVIMNDAVDERLFAELAATGIPVYRLDRREGHLHPRYLTKLLGIVRRHRVRIIHTHNDGSLAWGMAAKLAWPRLKLVYTQHAQGGAQEFHGLRKRAYRALVDMTVAISPFIAEEMRPLAGNKVTLVVNGTDIARFRHPKRQPGLKVPTRIVNVGRLAPVKGQDVLIDALAICRNQGRNLTCKLVGASSDPAYIEEIRSRIARHRLGNRVEIVLDRTDVEVFLKEADVFVLSSHTEGFGIAIIEAMASGLPAVVSATGGAMDIVTDGLDGLLFRPGNPHSLASRLLQLADDSVLRDQLSATGLVTARHYDIAITYEALARMYRLMAQPGGAAPGRRIGAQGVDTSAGNETPAADRPAA